jgi:hypothetical protein
MSMNPEEMPEPVPVEFDGEVAGTGACCDDDPDNQVGDYVGG